MFETGAINKVRSRTESFNDGFMNYMIDSLTLFIGYLKKSGNILTNKVTFSSRSTSSFWKFR